MNLAERLSSMRPQVRQSAGRFSVSFDFTKGIDETAAANRTSQLIGNIACLKDHLKVWCVKQSKPFTAEQLINSNSDVAIVHDLWNLDKHGALKKSRSGLFPRLGSPPATSLVMKAGPSGQQPMVNIPLFGSSIQANAGASLRVVATVVDKDGNVIGNLEAICERAIEAWEAEFKKSGVIS